MRRNEKNLNNHQVKRRNGGKTKENNSKYPPKAQTVTGVAYTSPPWSGHGELGQQSIKLSNTCTIDNLLYILVLLMKTRTFILSEVERIKAKDNWMSTLLEVYQHFLVEQWSQISWLKTLIVSMENFGRMLMEPKMTLWFQNWTTSIPL